MLTTTQLLAGYAQGIFPMAESAGSPRLHWFDPPRRGVLPIGGIHASRSLRRDLRRGSWSARLDGDFDAVVAACADRGETWINGELRAIYGDLHLAGHASALEVWRNGAIAGGIFGVTMGAAFFGESMVSQQRNGSRMALVWLSSHLKRCGFSLFDTQFLTPHLASMGGTEIPRSVYRDRLIRALARRADISAHPLPDADQLWQEITQTS